MKWGKDNKTSEDPKAFRRDVKRTKKAAPTDNRKAVKLLAQLATKPSKHK